MPQALNYLISKVETLEEKVNELSTKKDAPDSQEWMDIEDLRLYLPTHPAKQTIYGWVNENSIPYYKTSKKLTFRKSEIDEWIQGSRRLKTRFFIITYCCYLYAGTNFGCLTL